jgi:hypothetical protein
MSSVFRIAIRFASRLDRSLCARVVACLVAIVTLVPFSSVALHDCVTHFRFAGLAPVVARHTFVSPVQIQPRPRLIALHFQPMAPQLTPRLTLRDHFENDAMSQVPIVNRFCRLKLGPNRDCDAEPVA